MKMAQKKQVFGPTKRKKGDYFMRNGYKERVEMLNSVRENSFNRDMPAIHPRYGALYRELYKGDREVKSSLGIRILISLILFALFAAMEQGTITKIPISPSEITYQIETPLQLDMFQLVKR